MPEEGEVFLLSALEDPAVRALLEDRQEADVRRGQADLDRLTIMPGYLKRQLREQIGSYELSLTGGAGRPSPAGGRC
jgi:hypothetical protein